MSPPTDPPPPPPSGTSPGPTPPPPPPDPTVLGRREDPDESGWSAGRIGLVVGAVAIVAVVVVVALLLGLGGGDDPVAVTSSTSLGTVAPTSMPTDPADDPAPSPDASTGSGDTPVPTPPASALPASAPPASPPPASADVDQLRGDCTAGDQSACTDLFLQAAPGSDDEQLAIEGLAGAADGLELSDEAQLGALDLAWQNASASERETLCGTYVVNADAVVDVLVRLVGDGFEDAVVLDFLDEQCS